MAVPKRKQSHARTHTRKSEWQNGLSAPGRTTCPHCGETIMNYCACAACGHYRGRKVMAGAAEKKEEE
ncbi:MAG TPA: 50S ribosomal protein L32 [Synergistaceae bacterium]|jgi:large subunit ribosomal protein L32|nr:50S ribosomal protein L32 [Synergistaceae bacterium]